MFYDVFFFIFYSELFFERGRLVIFLVFFWVEFFFVFVSGKMESDFVLLILLDYE